MRMIVIKNLAIGPALSALAVAACLTANASAATAEPASAKSPCDFYNDGTQRLNDGRLRDAEASLQTAVASNDERVQPAALYNLGHVRFKQGAEALKEAPNAKAAQARGDAAANAADQAIKAADAALAGYDVDAIVRAYMQGRGARKELKAAMEAVKKALDAHGAVLSRWQRASGDFQSAYELRPSLTEAKFNGEVVDRHLAGLVDQQELMLMCMQCMGNKRQDLKQRMAQCKKRMPDGQQTRDDGEEEEDEEEDEQKPPQEPKPGQQEKENREGREMALTPEEALRLLESLKLDSNRKLPMGDKETGLPKDRKGREW